MRNILVANRGEIALRIMRTARALGYRVTAVYSEADAEAPHAALADTAIPIGPAAVATSYLDIDRILDAARQAGADAVHPGYGLLSENAAFARACSAAGLVFIGPRAETIERMGNKGSARLEMQAAGVACVPGYDAVAQDERTLLDAAERIGFPIMVKAAAGGGGRGMRRVNAASELGEALARARSEAQKAFGDGRLILERALDRARHVEVQVLADQHGHVVHLGERDCSVQRRFQKVIEEAPSPAVDEPLRAKLGAVAVLAARTAGYVGAGTVEMLLAESGEHYFLEMNTRIQVEHPVTELVTGIDIVEWQLRVAEGEALPFEHIAPRGHAIEARLYAEDPDRGFAPATGRVLQLALSQGDGLRIDHALAEGLVVSSHYDPMLGKLIAHGETRERARARLCRALEDLRVLGLQTNQSFLLDVLRHEGFVRGAATTDFLDREAVPGPRPIGPRALAAAAAVALLRARADAPYAAELCDFTNCAGLCWPVSFESGDQRIELWVEPQRDGSLDVRTSAWTVRLRVLRANARECDLLLDGMRERAAYAWDGPRLWLHCEGATHALTDVTRAPARESAAHGSGRALAPMDGAVIEVPVQVGQRVSRGQTLAVVEAMKLELRVPADRDGVVAAVRCQRGDQVKARQVLVELSDGGSA
jgi:geranyl-CoA carboxylase alpha subunit